MTFAPRLEIVCAMDWEEPRPISIMAMTAAMPMTIPKIVSADLMTLRRNACNAIRSTLEIVFIENKLPSGA